MQSLEVHMCGVGISLHKFLLIRLQSRHGPLKLGFISKNAKIPNKLQVNKLFNTGSNPSVSYFNPS